MATKVVADRDFTERPYAILPSHLGVTAGPSLGVYDIVADIDALAPASRYFSRERLRALRLPEGTIGNTSGPVLDTCEGHT